ncbi:hypothetical protein DFH08DRAFT_699704, partial [Mycena albidolilacea]
DWPTGHVRREVVKGEEDHKWKHNKWAWRSNGTVQHEGHAAELRICLGVFRCEGCGRFTRPKTQAASRQKQLENGCTSRTCSLEAPLVHDRCEARSLHYKVERGGETILVWEHFGDHSTHERPPGGGLSKVQEDQIDLQVIRKQEANVHQLRTGDSGPGSVPLADISPGLANARAARYAVGKSQDRLGITASSLKGGLATISAIGDLQKRLPTPFIRASSLSGPVFINLQTPFMDEIIKESVESWILDLTNGPTAARHGFVIDGDLTFFQMGTLLATCAYSMTSNEWTPVLYSWINHQDTAHHRPHFAHIFESVIKHAGSRFNRKMLLCVMDFSAAQRAAHAEEYADAIIAITPGFSQLSAEAQKAERKHLVREAEKGEVGCDTHFWRSADRIKKTHSVVPPNLASTFENSLRELLSPRTTSDRFDEVVRMLKITFPAAKNWFAWWERGPIASMIFPAKSAVDPEVAAKVPSTSNPIEHQHSLLHHAVGKDQELVPGMEKIFLHVREMEKKYLAIKDGHFNAAEPRNRRVPKQRALQENDGRAPDTIAALAAADFQFNTAGSTPSANLPTGPSAAHFLKSYKWDAPNSCFFDNVMEIWYRAFSRWPDQKRALFLSWLPPRSALADFFYHFQRRLRWIASASPDDLDGVRELGLGQAKARYAIFTRWKLYSNPAAYGSSIVWIPHAIRDCDPCDDVQLTFGVGHFLSGTCSAKHSCSIAVGGIQTVLSIDPFDLRVARAKYGSAVTLTEYFSTATPRIDETVVHSFPAPDCEEPDCLGESSPLVFETIETVWPKILHIDPYTGTQDPLLHTKVFTIDDGQGGLIVYELIGTISHDAEKLHWTSKFLIDDITFSYDDLARGGSLVAQGPGDVIIEPDRTAVLWVYHRSTDIMEVCMTIESVH